jgi:hypothetical protein
METFFLWYSLDYVIFTEIKSIAMQKAKYIAANACNVEVKNNVSEDTF